MLETASVASSDAAQAAARAEFLSAMGAGGGGGFIDFSSDEDDDADASSATGSAAGTITSAGAASGAGAGRKIKIQIRDKGGNPVAAGPTGSDAAVRLAPPGAPPPSRLGVPPPPPGGGGSTLTPTESLQFPPGMSSAQLYGGGAARMEAGDWRGAAAHFSRAMAVLLHDERAVMDEASRKARLSFCAQYYAAVRLLEAVGTAAGPREARLYRWVVGLAVDGWGSHVWGSGLHVC